MSKIKPSYFSESQYVKKNDRVLQNLFCAVSFEAQRNKHREGVTPPRWLSRLLTFDVYSVSTTAWAQQQLCPKAWWHIRTLLAPAPACTMRRPCSRSICVSTGYLPFSECQFQSGNARCKIRACTIPAGCLIPRILDPPSGRRSRGHYKCHTSHWVTCPIAQRREGDQGNVDAENTAQSTMPKSGR